MGVAEIDLEAAIHPTPIGAAATPVFDGKIDSTWLDENEKTRGTNWRGEPGKMGESQKMLVHPHVRTGRDVVVDPVVAGLYDFEAGGSRPVDKEAAKLCRRVFFKQLPWKRNLGEILRAVWSDGFAIPEFTTDVRALPVDEFPLHPGGGFGVEITGLYVRPGWSIHGFDQNPSNAAQLAGVTQYVHGSDVEEPSFIKIPSSRFIRFTWEQIGANYEGLAPGRSAWGPWYLLRLLQRIEVIGHEKNHLSQPFATKESISAGSDDQDKKIAKILAAWRTHEKGSYVLPFGYKLNWSEHGAQTNIRETIKDLKFDLAHNSQAGFMTLGTSTGSHALAGTQQGTFHISLYKWSDFVCEVFNHGLDGWSIVELIVRLNYGPDVAIPKMVCRYLPTVNFEKTLPILGALIDKKIVRRGRPQFDAELERYALAGLRAPVPDPDEEFEEVEPVTEPPATDEHAAPPDGDETDDDQESADDAAEDKEKQEQ